MEQLLNDNIYVIDLGNIDNAAEIIFSLTSELDKSEVKNKRICLKLGNVSLNQAQLLSIKSLISGIDSILSSIDTKSVETEKVALSLGIIVSNISAENTLDVSPTAPYKMADEIKEDEQNNSDDSSIVENPDDDNVIVEENDENTVADTQGDSEIVETADDSQLNETTEIIENNENPEIVENPEYENSIENNNNEVVQSEPEENSSETDENSNNNVINLEEKNSENIVNNNVENVSASEVQDELDVIFGSNPTPSIFDMNVPEEIYEDREELTDIVVPEQEYTKEDIELESFPTKYIKQTIRSGQVINYEGNIVIVGDCHPGCEIVALGDVTVWGVLSGIAHAGSGGNQKARVRALKMNAIQLRIANCYSRRPDSLNTVYIEKTSSFTPEEARIINGEIVVFKMND